MSTNKLIIFDLVFKSLTVIALVYISVMLHNVKTLTARNEKEIQTQTFKLDYLDADINKTKTVNQN